MKLFYFPGACSLAPHIVLEESGTAFTIEKTDLATKKTETGADFLAINPKGYVPALLLDDGYVLTEAAIIQQYIADSVPAKNLAPAHGTRERLKLDEQMQFIATELHKGFGPLFSPTTPDNAKPAFIEKIGQRFDVVEKTLADGRPFIMGDHFTIADAYLFTISGWSQYVGIDLAKWPTFAAYAQRIAQRPAVQAALKAEGLM